MGDCSKVCFLFLGVLLQSFGSHFGVGTVVGIVHRNTGSEQSESMSSHLSGVQGSV